MNLLNIGKKLNYSDTNEGKIFAEEINAIVSVLEKSMIETGIEVTSDYDKETLLLRAIDKISKASLYRYVDGAPFNGRNYTVARVGVRPDTIKDLFHGAVYTIVLGAPNAHDGTDSNPITLSVDGSEPKQLLLKGLNPLEGELTENVTYTVMYNEPNDRFEIIGGNGDSSSLLAAVMENASFTLDIVNNYLNLDDPDLSGFARRDGNATVEFKVKTPVEATGAVPLSMLGNYANINGSINTIFKVKDAVGNNDATSLSQVNTIVSGEINTLHNEVIGSIIGNIIVNPEVTRINQSGFDGSTFVPGEYGWDGWLITANGMTQIIESDDFDPNTEYTLSGIDITTVKLTSPASGNWKLPDIPRTSRKISLVKGDMIGEYITPPYALDLMRVRRSFIKKRVTHSSYVSQSLGALGKQYMVDFTTPMFRVPVIRINGFNSVSHAPGVSPKVDAVLVDEVTTEYVNFSYTLEPALATLSSGATVEFDLEIDARLYN